MQSSKMPDAWRESVIVPKYKDDADTQDCGSFRGITVLSLTLIILEKIIGKSLRCEQNFGFMPGRRTMDAIFSLRQRLEKHGEK